MSSVRKPRTRVCAAAAALDESASIAQRAEAALKNPSLLQHMSDKTHHAVIVEAITKKFSSDKSSAEHEEPSSPADK
jgi:hypothetical protein